MATNELNTIAKVTLLARTQGLRAFTEVKKSLEEINVKAKETRGAFTKLSNKVKSGGQALKKFYGPIAITSILTGFTALASTAIGLGNEFQDMSDKTGISTVSLASWTRVAETAAVSQEALEKGLLNVQRSMTRSVKATTDLVTGQETLTLRSSASSEVFKKWGIDIIDTSGKLRGTEEVFEDISDVIKGLEKNAQNTSDIMTVLGQRSGPKLIPLLDKGADGINRYADAIGPDFANNADIFLDRVARGKERLNIFLLVIADKALPIILKLEDKIADLAKWIAKTAKNIGDFGRSVGETIENVSSKIQKVIDVFYKIDERINSFLEFAKWKIFGKTVDTTLGLAISGFDRLGNSMNTILGIVSNVGRSFSKALKPIGQLGNILGISGNTNINIPKFARGGVVNKRTLAEIGEKGPEAVVPLEGGRSIPVTIKGAGGANKGQSGGFLGFGGSGLAMMGGGLIGTLQQTLSLIENIKKGTGELIHKFGELGHKMGEGFGRSLEFFGHGILRVVEETGLLSAAIKIGLLSATIAFRKEIFSGIGKAIDFLSNNMGKMVKLTNAIKKGFKDLPNQFNRAKEGASGFNASLNVLKNTTISLQSQLSKKLFGALKFIDTKLESSIPYYSKYKGFVVDLSSDVINLGASLREKLNPTFTLINETLSNNKYWLGFIDLLKGVRTQIVKLSHSIKNTFNSAMKAAQSVLESDIPLYQQLKDAIANLSSTIVDHISNLTNLGSVFSEVSKRVKSLGRLFSKRLKPSIKDTSKETNKYNTNVTNLESNFTSLIPKITQIVDALKNKLDVLRGIRVEASNIDKILNKVNRAGGVGFTEKYNPRPREDFNKNIFGDVGNVDPKAYAMLSAIMVGLPYEAEKAENKLREAQQQRLNVYRDLITAVTDSSGKYQANIDKLRNLNIVYSKQKEIIKDETKLLKGQNDVVKNVTVEVIKNNKAVDTNNYVRAKVVDVIAKEVNGVKLLNQAKVAETTQTVKTNTENVKQKKLIDLLIIKKNKQKNLVQDLIQKYVAKNKVVKESNATVRKEVETTKKLNTQLKENVVQKQKVVKETVKQTKANKDLGRSMEKVRVEAKKLPGPMKSMNTQFGTAIARTKKTTSGITGILGGIASLAKKIPGLGLIVSGFMAIQFTRTIVRWKKEVLEWAAELGNVSQKVKISASAIRELRTEAHLADISFGEVETSLRHYTSTINRARAGKVKFVQAFEELGISLKDTEGNYKSNTKVLEEVSNRLIYATDRSKAFAAADKLLGKQILSILPALTKYNGKIEELGSKFDDQSKAANDFATQWAQLKIIYQNLWRSLVLEMLPAINSVATGFINATNAMLDFFGIQRRMNPEHLINRIGTVRAEIDRLQDQLEGGRHGNRAANRIQTQLENLQEEFTGFANQTVLTQEKLDSLWKISQGNVENYNRLVKSAIDRKKVLVAKEEEIKAKTKEVVEVEEEVKEVQDSITQSTNETLEVVKETHGVYNGILMRLTDIDNLKKKAAEADAKVILDHAQRIERLYDEEYKKIGDQMILERQLDQQRLDNIRTIHEAQQKSMEELAEHNKKLANEQIEISKKLGQEAGNTILEMIKGTKTWRNVLFDIAQRVIPRIIDKLFEAATVQKQASSGGFLGGIISGIGSFFGFEKGGIMTKDGPLPLRKYQRGGIANSPQLALYGEGSRNEAYVPLPDNRRIPVKLEGSNSGIYNTINISINNNNTSSNVQTRSAEEDRIMAQKFSKLIDSRLKTAIINERRPGGILAR